MGALTEISKVKEIEKGSILTPRGFSAGGIHAGLRYTKKDIGMIVSEVPATSAAVYTINHFQAAPLKVTQDSLKESSPQIISASLRRSAKKRCQPREFFQISSSVNPLTVISSLVKYIFNLLKASLSKYIVMPPAVTTLTVVYVKKGEW